MASVNPPVRRVVLVPQGNIWIDPLFVLRRGAALRLEGHQSYYVVSLPPSSRVLDVYDVLRPKVKPGWMRPDF